MYGDAWHPLQEIPGVEQHSPYNNFGKLKRAERYAKYFFLLQFLLTLLAAAFIVLIRWKVIALYQPGISDEVAELVSRCLIVFAIFTPVKMFNYVNVVGVLRSGGDPAKVQTPAEASAALQAVTRDDVRAILRKLTLSVSYLLTKEVAAHAAE